MKCPYCAKELPENAERCPACGKAINVALQNEEEYVGPLGSSRPILTWGILAAVLGCIPFTCILGVIFGAIGLSKAARYIRFTGSMFGPARAGRILSIVGIAAGAIVSVLTTLWVIHLTGAKLPE